MYVSVLSMFNTHRCIRKSVRMRTEHARRAKAKTKQKTKKNKKDFKTEKIEKLNFYAHCGDPTQISRESKVSFP